MVLDIPTLRRLQIHYVGCTAPTPTKFVGVAIKLYYPELRLTPNALPNEIVTKPKFEENYNADGFSLPSPPCDLPLVPGLKIKNAWFDPG